MNKIENSWCSLNLIWTVVYRQKLQVNEFICFVYLLVIWHALHTIKLECISYFMVDRSSHRSPEVSLAPAGCASGDTLLMLLTFPKMWSKITNPMYATENRRIVFGDIDQPSAPSEQQKDRLLALWPPVGAWPPRGLRPVDLARAAATFLAMSFLFYSSIY